MTLGSRPVVQPNGGVVERPANLTTSAITWLARRSDADGRPWLTPVEVAAAEQLTIEAETASRGTSVTMRWDALPRTGSGQWNCGYTPGDRELAAARRLERALFACGGARCMVEHICLHNTSLQAAEQSLGLRRRSGRLLLKQGLGALAAHYKLMASPKRNPL